MADGKVEKNTLNLSIILWMTISKVLIELGVVKINIGNLISVVVIHVQTHLVTIVSFKKLRKQNLLTIAVSIWKLSSWELFKFHDILSEGTCLVRENIVYLAKLLIQITRKNFCRHILINIIYSVVPSNEESLKEFHYF